MSEFNGVYRGAVFDIDDPENRGRLRILVPSVLGNSPSSWAEPTLTPSAGFTPETGGIVWVEFEGGNLNHPVYHSRMEVNSDDIAPGAVGFESIAPGAVGFESIAPGAVGFESIAPGAVGFESIDVPLTSFITNVEGSRLVDESVGDEKRIGTDLTNYAWDWTQQGVRDSISLAVGATWNFASPVQPESPWRIMWDTPSTGFPTTILSDSFPVKPGDVFEFTFDANRQSGTNWDGWLTFTGVDANGVFVDNSPQNCAVRWDSSSVPANSTWTTVTGTITIPANVVSVRLSLQKDGTGVKSDAVTGRWYFRQPRIRRRPDYPKLNWINASFSNGWANYGTSHRLVQYAKDPFGIVHIRGLLLATAATANSIFWLPDAAYRPLADEIFLQKSDGTTVTEVRVTSGGWVLIQGARPTSWLSLAGITYEGR